MRRSDLTFRTVMDMSDTGTRKDAHEYPEERWPGIVIRDGRRGDGPVLEPRISAFIWGGKVRPTPTLPFGRWKGAA
jgi:hypothetical protein